MTLILTRCKSIRLPLGAYSLQWSLYKKLIRMPHNNIKNVLLVP